MAQNEGFKLLSHHPGQGRSHDFLKGGSIKLPEAGVWGRAGGAGAYKCILGIKIAILEANRDT